MSEFSRVLNYGKTSLAVGLAGIAVGAYQNDTRQDNLRECEIALIDKEIKNECIERASGAADGDFLAVSGTLALLWGAFIAGFVTLNVPDSVNDYRRRRRIDSEVANANNDK
jgi:hypothetical protein